MICTFKVLPESTHLSIFQFMKCCWSRAVVLVIYKTHINPGHRTQCTYQNSHIHEFLPLCVPTDWCHDMLLKQSVHPHHLYQLTLTQNKVNSQGLTRIYASVSFPHCMFQLISVMTCRWSRAIVLTI